MSELDPPKQEATSRTSSKIVDLPRGGKPVFRRRVPAKSGSPAGEHFWVSTYPFFESTLFCVPAPSSLEPSHASLKIFDCDGALVNEAALSYGAGKVGVVELDAFLGGCKLESGLKHAHVIASGSSNVSFFCQLHAREAGAILGSTLNVYATQPAFYPITLSEERRNFVTVVNHGETASTIRCRLFCGSRTPEISVLVPGYGARIIGVESEFADCGVKAGEKQLQAYVRFSTKGESGLGVQLVERFSGSKENNFYQSVS